MPYLYTLYRRAAENGEPMLRPLFYEFDDDPRAFADCDDFMLGPYLLVANVLDPGQRERRVYLPRGVEGWYDFHTGAYHRPGAEIVVEAPLNHIPLFAPAGALIPMTRGDDFGRLHDEPSRHLRVFPAQGTSNPTFQLYEDDGISTGYRDGDYAEVRFDLKTSSTAIVLEAYVMGRFALPYREITVELPANERRPLTLHGEGIALAALP
jgi:alpha-glucosidase